MNKMLGKKVRDTVSGFEGIITSRVEYINGCVQFCVTPKVVKDNIRPDSEYIDEAQIEIIKEEKVEIESKRTGGHQANTPPFTYQG